MCIIAVSAHGIKPLTKDVLGICFANNPDGAGFAYWDIENQIWKVEKGLMSFQEFWAAYEAHNFTDADYVVCHFRVGTSGLKDKGNTHPFPICKDIEEMRQIKFETKNMLIHNGVVGTGEAIASDTMCFVRDYVAPLHQFIKKDIRIIKILEELANDSKGRWFVTQGPTIWQWGTWEKDKESGWEFSNLGFRSVRSASVTTYADSISKYYQRHRETYGIPYGDEDYSYTYERKHTPVDTRPKGYLRYYKQNGVFDIQSWKEDMSRKIGLIAAPKLPEPAVHKGVVTTLPADIAEDFVYGILNDDDQIVWERASESNKKNSDEYLFCPECFEDNHLMESPYEGYGDTLCYTCGAIFEDATGRIVHYDEDYRKIYLERVAKRMEKK